uniref:Uncharacterized protein n=1 Tax=Anguilla anguilla TaxID=7936 RepID=A0A0E9XBJ1_ANGAN
MLSFSFFRFVNKKKYIYRFTIECHSSRV